MRSTSFPRSRAALSARRRVLPAAVFAAGLATALCASGCSVAVDSGATPTGGSGGAPSTSSAPGVAIPTPEVSVPPIVVPTAGAGSGSTGPGTGGGSGAGSTGTGAAALPTGFPIPPGVAVGDVVRDGHEIDATFTASDTQAAYDWWRTNLPTAGYAVADAQAVGGAGAIRFSGHECTSGNTQLAFTPQRIALQCTLQ